MFVRIGASATIGTIGNWRILLDVEAKRDDAGCIEFRVLWSCVQLREPSRGFFNVIFFLNRVSGTASLAANCGGWFGCRLVGHSDWQQRLG
jgi:hypothetical protein